MRRRSISHQLYARRNHERRQPKGIRNCGQITCFRIIKKNQIWIHKTLNSENTCCYAAQNRDFRLPLRWRSHLNWFGFLGTWG